jgi:xanthine dehydrogenase accessory factor
MDSCDMEVFRTAQAWLAAGRTGVMGTVVHTWGSSPRPPGSLMVIRDDGQVSGSVSGGCIEDDLVYRLREGRLRVDSPEVTVYGATAEEAQRFGLPCGGSVQLVLEPLTPASGIDCLLEALEQHQVMRRELDMRTGRVSLLPAASEDTVHFDGGRLVTVHGPRYRLLIIGAGQLSRYLASMAVMLDYEVTVCDPRSEYHEAWDGLGGVQFSTAMPDDLVLAMGLDARSAVVAVSHDPKLDDLALMEALRTEAFYVGALGSRSNNDKRRRRLLEFDLSPAQVAALHGPVGLRIGALTPPEIVLSILAQLTAIRRGAEAGTACPDWPVTATECRTAVEPASLLRV